MPRNIFLATRQIISSETPLLQVKTLDLFVSTSYYCFLLETRGEGLMHSHRKQVELKNHFCLDALITQNTKLARRIWEITTAQVRVLKTLSREFKLSVALGDLILLDRKWYVTHAGLLRLAQRRHCAGIRVQQVREFCDPAANRWVFKATLYKRPGAPGFVGFGDADPSNVSSLVQGAELRIAETRAVNRALRKAYGIGICSVEELGAFNASSAPSRSNEPSTSFPPQNGSGNGQPRLKDKLCLLIRQYNLDSTLVKAYAAEFCGTETLRGASRELVEAFITKLEQEAREDRDRLVCKLNSFSRPVEVAS